MDAGQSAQIFLELQRGNPRANAEIFGHYLAVCNDQSVRSPQVVGQCQMRHAFHQCVVAGLVTSNYQLAVPALHVAEEDCVVLAGDRIDSHGYAGKIIRRVSNQVRAPIQVAG